jgi:polyhydroxyalkanoate synthesis repressor PhaR
MTMSSCIPNSFEQALGGAAGFLALPHPRQQGEPCQLRAAASYQLELAIYWRCASLAAPPPKVCRAAINNWPAQGQTGYARLWGRGSATIMTDEKEPITIKKYANRRLYNTGTSAYVTLEDLATMVKEGENFVVFDAKSGEDITRSVLAQIIFEQENKEGQSLLPIAFLRQLIRFYGDSMQMLVPRFLEQSMQSLTSQQGKFREQMAQAFGGVGFGAMEDQVRRNMEMFEKTFAMFAPFARGQSKSEEKPQSASGEMDDLKRQLDELQKRIDRLGKE